jgi:hypothetical protein
MGINFDSEFTDNCIRPVVMLSDRVAVQTIISAWLMSIGTVLQGNTELIKELCGLTMRHFIELTIAETTNEDQMNCLLKGYLLSNTWACFIVSSPLTR